MKIGWSKGEVLIYNQQLARKRRPEYLREIDIQDMYNKMLNEAWK
jgi:hypothetical protein